MKGEEPKYWLDDPRNVVKIVRLLFVLCALLVGIDIFYPKHGKVPIENWPGFFAVFGVVACVGLAVVARGLRVLLKRREDYYDE